MAKQQEMTLPTRIVVLASMSMLPMIATDIYLPSMPSIITHLDTSHSYLQLTLSLFMLGLAIGQLVYGGLVDQFGRRRVLFWSLALYLGAALVCSFAHSVTVLIIARIIQALGASGPMVISFSATRDIEDDVERTRVMSYNAMALSVSPAFAPVLGAFLQESIGWQANFLAMVVFGIIVAVLAYFKLSEAKHFQPTPSKLRWAHTMFINYSHVIRNSYFWCYSLCAAVVFAGLMSFIINSSFILMVLAGLDANQFALLFGCNALTLVFGSMLGIKLRKRLGLDKNIMVGASLILIGGCIMLVRALFFHVSGFIIIPVLICSFGVILVMPAANARSLSPFLHHAGSAAAVTNSVRMIIAAIVGSGVGFLIPIHFAVLSITMIICAIGVFIPLHIRISRQLSANPNAFHNNKHSNNTPIRHWPLRELQKEEQV